MTDDTDPEATEDQPDEQADTAPDEGGSEAGSDDQGPPDIEDEEKAEVPEGLSDIDPDEVEEEAGAGSDDESGEDGAADTDEGSGAAESMDPDSGTSPAQAGELYVSVVQSVTNAQIRKHGGDELDSDHFEKYDLAEHFNATMNEMGVGSDLDSHEALLMATVLSVGDGLVSETDVLDKQIDRLMDKAMNGGEAA